MEKTALVTGGYGYLGSHLCKYLHRKGYRVIVYDIRNQKTHDFFSESYNHSDIRDRVRLESVFQKHHIDVVFHLAGRIEVGESMKYPTEFWDVNVAGTANLLNIMSAYRTRNIIFSSTAAVYKPTSVSIEEAFEQANNSVYGNTKIACENMIRDSGFNYGIFRYFNLAGCDYEVDIGENHEPETHLIPNIFKNINNFVINGNSYSTHDGTCVRDYVHVSDIANAHIIGAEHVMNENSFVVNLGTGEGHSILDIIKIIEEITPERVNYSFGPKRDGDPDHLVANINRAKELFGYQPKYDIRSIVETAYKWHKKLKEKQ
jgi:UDP-glucose 4-epimerase